MSHRRIRVPSPAICLVLIALFVPNRVLGAPAAYLDGPEDLTWFVAISDTHVGAAELLYGDKDLERLEWASSTLVSVVDPAFVVNAGDLTDATSWGLVPSGPVETEWIEYAETVAGNGMDPGFYFDLPGNHDHYGDGDLSYYRTWSVAGGADGATNHAWTFSAGVTDCLALALATCASDGAPAPTDHASLDGTDQAFAEDTLATHPDEEFVLVFGHHPVDDLGEGRDILEAILSLERVGLYLYGHTHDWHEYWDLGTLHLNVASLTKSEHNNVAVVAVDGGGLSVGVFDVQDWPQVLVTAPLDRDLGGGHLQAYQIPWYLEEAPVRALAFDPSGVGVVEWSLDGESWTPMEEVEEHVYQGTFDATLLSEYPQTLRVRAFGADGGEPAVHEVKILSDPYAEPPDAPDPVEVSPEIAEPPGDVVSEDTASDADVGTGVEEIMESDAADWRAEKPELAERPADAAPSPDVPGRGVPETADEDGSTSAPLHPVADGARGGCAAATQPGAAWPLWLVLLGLLWCRQSTTRAAAWGGMARVSGQIKVESDCRRQKKTTS